MKLLKSKKGVVLLATLVVAAAAAIGAYAYFTSTGHGTGSATVGSATNWTVGETGSPSGGPLYPDTGTYPAGPFSGAHVQTDTYTVTNGGSGSQNLANVAISVANANGSAWSAQADLSKPACTAADFSVGGQAAGATWNDTTLAQDFAAGDSHSSTVTVEMVDNGANQDNCQGVTVPLYFSAS